MTSKLDERPTRDALERQEIPRMAGLDLDVERLLKIAESSNSPLPDLAKQQLQPLIWKIRKDLDLCLGSNRAEKAAHLARLRSAVSLGKELPHEIISEIFVYCVLKPFRVGMGLACRSVAPWNLTQVCSAWRQVALGIPDLWNHIVVLFRYSMRIQCIHMICALKTSLERSRHSLISLEILIGDLQVDDLGVFDASMIDDILDVVLPYLGRLTHLSLQPCTIFKRLLSLRGGIAGALQSVFLSFPGTRHREAVPSHDLAVTTFDLAHSLRHVVIITKCNHVILDAFCFPWAQLTRLEIKRSYVKFAEGHAMLRQCVQLVSCTLGIASDFGCRGIVPDTNIPTLQSLTIYPYPYGGTCGRFLQPFVLPSLKHLTLCDASHFQFTDKVVSLIHRSSCHLQSFRAMGVHPHGISDILSASPSLVDLSLGIKYGPAEGLISDIANYALAPNVQTFQTPLRYADLFMGMLEHGFVPSVQSVTILGSMQKACGAVLISANQLRAQGIDVTFQVDDHMEI